MNTRTAVFSKYRVPVSIVRTGIANMASVVAGLRRAGAKTSFVEKVDDIQDATAVVMPGVGAFGAGMQQLREDGYVEALRERIAQGRPTLAVCLGLHLLLETSEETPGVEGLGVISDCAKRFPETVRVPQLGWNYVQPDGACALLTPGYAYFANSYRLEMPPAGWNCGHTQHGGSFVSAFERGTVLACQFHPELSGQWGIELLRRWLHAAGGAAC